MSKSLLDRPEFAVLRRLSPEQLRRINPATAERYDWTVCPLGQAFEGQIETRIDLVYRITGKYARKVKKQAVREEARRFTDWWDDHAVIYRADLAAAICAALAEKGGAQ